MVYWYDFVYSPPGFYGKDIAIDALSAVVVLLIGFFSFKNYLLDSKNKKHLFISFGYLFLGFSFIAKIVTNWLTHSEALTGRGIILLGQLVAYSDLSAIGFLLHAFLTLFGFYILYVLTSKDKLTMNYVLIAYFILLSTYFARFNYYLFYFTALLFLASISRRYFLAYWKYGNKNTRRLAISFSIIALSHAVFMFTTTNRTLYVLAEMIQLIGYSYLLYTFVMVLKNARQKK